MDLFHVVLRVVHMGAGILWVGSAAFMHFFIEPTMHALGPQGGPFMTYMIEKRKVPVVIAVSAVLTVAAGIILYWRDTDGFDPDLVTTSVGIGFGVGGIAAIIAFVLGVGVVRPMVVRMGSMAGAMASGSSSPEQIQEFGALQRKLRSISTVNLILLAISVVAMAGARYF